MFFLDLMDIIFKIILNIPLADSNLFLCLFFLWLLNLERIGMYLLTVLGAKSAELISLS